MSYKIPFIMLSVGILIAGVIPIALSQVQEDAFMEIDMLETQVENPFRIQDYQDNDVFAIDNKGRVPTGGTGWNEFFWQMPPNTVIEINGDTHLFATPLVLWQIDTPNTSSALFERLVNNESILAGEGRYISGAGDCELRVEYTEDDGVSWDSYGMDIGAGIFGDFPWNWWYDFWHSDAISENIDSVRLIAYANDPTAICEMRDVAFAYGILRHPDMIVTEVTYYVP